MKRLINIMGTLAVIVATLLAGAMAGPTAQPAAPLTFLNASTTYAQAKGQTAPYTLYQGVVIVAKAGGDFTNITSALTSITNNSTDNRYLVWVAPGVYTETVRMKQFVDIEGSGEGSTIISQRGSSTGTLIGASNAELRFLTVRNTGGSSSALAISSSSASPSLLHVTATAAGGTSGNVGIRFLFSSPTMNYVTAVATGGDSTDNYGVINTSSASTMNNVIAKSFGGKFTHNYGIANGSSSPSMTNVTVSVSGGTPGVSRGVDNVTSSPSMTNVTISASGYQSYGVDNETSSSPFMSHIIITASGLQATGVENNFHSSPTMSNVLISAVGEAIAYGVLNGTSSPIIEGSTIKASGGTDGNFGIWNASLESNTLKVNNSQISGSTNTISNTTQFTTLVGASQLDGGPVLPNVGTITCAGVYDENYVFFANTCP